MTDTGLTSYIGDYDDFISKNRLADPISEQISEKPKNLDYQEQKRIQSEKRKLINRFNKVEELISQLEAEVEAINKEMMDPKLSADFTKLNELSQTAEEKNNAISELMDEWATLQTEIEKMD